MLRETTNIKSARLSNIEELVEEKLNKMKLMPCYSDIEHIELVKLALEFVKVESLDDNLHYMTLYLDEIKESLMYLP